MKREKILKFINSMNNLNLNNIKNIIKIINDKNYNIVIDNSKNNVDAQIRVIENNEIEIRINSKSKREIEYLIIHEVTHAIETKEMQYLVLDYVNKHNDFNMEVNEIENSYKIDDIRSEIVAIVAGILFGNQKFIDHLTLNNSNIFKRIYKKIISLLNKITRNSYRVLFIQELKHKWEDAYINTTYEQAVKNLDGKIEFSKQLKDILLRNKNLDDYSKIPIIYSNEQVIATLQNSIRLQRNFKNNIKNGEYENKATGYIASITSETKSKIMNPSQKTNKTGKEYILRMISANNLPELFKNAVYIDTLKPMKGKSSNSNELGYHHFVAPINIDGVYYRVLISGKEKKNSKKLYSLGIELLPQKNGNVPRVNQHSLNGTLPSDINISDLVHDVNIFNYDTGQYQTYNDSDIKYSIQ